MHLPHLSSNDRVFFRIDGNVPLENGKILNDFRLRALIPTLSFLKESGAAIMIATHIGRPVGFDPALSTKFLRPWFDNHGFSSFVLHENLRFDPREQQGSEELAQSYAQDFNWYLTDAWGVLHRHDTSVTLLPRLFPKNRRSIGLLIDHELEHLWPLRTGPQPPFVTMVGGGKPETKLSYLTDLVKTGHIQTIVPLPANIFSLLAALGKSVGLSLVTDELIEQARKLLAAAQAHSVELIFPKDFVIATGSWDGPRSIISANEPFPANAIGISVGPETLTQLTRIIAGAGTVFYNGLMGNIHDTVLNEPLFDALSSTNAYTVLGGGDAVSMAEKLGKLEKIGFCSTGGGSTLAFISGTELPGLVALGITH
ncbi:MAG: phosphoglycerate kinase [Candidatus Babeliaceae bacterium]|nr:phosphoglycerate kinase [Candidatus Babeliaceae bacterium]